MPRRRDYVGERQGVRAQRDAPLYNVIVYVPNGPLDPIDAGISCDQCGTLASGDPITTALSDSTGHFVLNNVPVGSNIPLVVQLGKWRRETTISTVLACQDNPLTDPNLTRLPKNQGEGSMPHIALTTGGCDSLGCMLPKESIDPERVRRRVERPVEGHDPRRYDAGRADRPPWDDLRWASPSLWTNLPLLSTYDMGIFLVARCRREPAVQGDLRRSPRSR